MAESKKNAAEEVAETKKKTSEKMVTIRIPRMRKDEEDEVVWVNDRRFIIKKGIEVEVPACVEEVLRHRDEMRERAYIFEESLKNKE